MNLSRLYYILLFCLIYLLEIYQTDILEISFSSALIYLLHFFSLQIGKHPLLCKKTAGDAPFCVFE